MYQGEPMLSAAEHMHVHGQRHGPPLRRRLLLCSVQWPPVSVADASANGRPQGVQDVAKL